MKEKNTGDLSEELMSQPNIGEYISNNRGIFTGQGVAELLKELYRRCPCKKAELARKAGMSEVYLHQVFSGRRSPSRDRLLCICVGLEATLEETQQILRQTGYAQLYPKIKRDAIVSHGLLHRRTLREINEALFAEDEKSLS